MSNLSFTTNLFQDTGLYYDRYLREVIEVLETDPHFREKLQTANTEDIKVSISSSSSLSSLSFSELRLDDLIFNVFLSPGSSQNGRLSKELDLVSHNVRTRLDELKRQEVSRLRMLLKAKLDSTNTQSESTQRERDAECFLSTVDLGEYEENDAVTVN